MGSYGVVDLTAAPNTTGVDTLTPAGQVDLEKLRDQLTDIRDALHPLLEADATTHGLGLASVEVKLSVGFEGKVLFVAKGSAEASITLTFARVTAAT